MSRFAEPAWRRRLDRLAWVVVTGLGLWLCWPAPRGVAPLSADHTVHLTRIWMWAQTLAGGDLRGYSDIWFFGAPVGELYPILGDAIIIAIRGLGLGLLDWHQAYGLGFALVFVSQGWAMLRLGQTCGLGPLPGLVAAVLLLCDAGAYREGGWIYTVSYGVWPQALATSLTWLAMAELATAVAHREPGGRARAVARGGAWAAGAILAHPISLPVFVLMAPVAWVVLGRGRRRNFGDAGFFTAATLVLGLALASWWLVPMMAMRGWMVSYGWLWQPLDAMVAAGRSGHLTQTMPPAVAVLIVGGVLAVAVVGSNPARAWAALGVLLWLWTSADVFWRLRLDLVDPAFGQMQWQRFLITAKPGLFCSAGCGLALGVRAVRRLALGGWWARALAVMLGGGLLGVVGMAAWGQFKVGQRFGVGTLQTLRDPRDPSLDRDYAQLIERLNALAGADTTGGWRVSVQAPRNTHWFMDAPVLTGLPLYKQGFTPGDNFVHKPESAAEALLDRLQVRYVVTRGRGWVPRANVVERAGALQVWERERWSPQPRARIDGVGTVEILEQDLQGGVMIVEVRGAAAGDRLVFDVAGYPRWELTRDGEPVEWVEVPAVGTGPSATVAERKAGQLRGGKAGGDDGTEPILMAAPAEDGIWRLRYRSWMGRDVLAALVSMVGAGLWMLLWGWPRRIKGGSAIGGDGGDIPVGAAALERLRGWVAPFMGPWLLVGLVVLGLTLAVVRVRGGRQVERGQAVGWVERGRAQGVAVEAGPLKTDMLIRPALLVTPNADARSEAMFTGVRLGERLTGFVALDDDAATMRRAGSHRVVVEVRPHRPDADDGGTDDTGSWTILFDSPVAHRPGRRLLALPTGDLAGHVADVRVRVTTTGASPPPLGYDLDLGEPAL